ncbi:MAG: hypothetical protein LBT38_01750 [Deltaproteobacteria bacterium]|nr:hypothetical protein [Deltaproteobacteria bacterium]
MSHLKIFFLAIALAIGCLAWSEISLAHSAFMNCTDSDDGNITCEGGFSDGSSASGVKVKVIGADGQEIASGAMNADDEYVFKKPTVDYKVVFDAGDGHDVTVEGKNIVK